MVQVPEILFHYNINEIARICRVSLKTARRWKAGQVGTPDTAIMVLSRDVGIFHPDWSGWTVNDRGELCSPENWIATPGSVLAAQFHQSQLATYRSENRALKAALASMDAQQYEEQPLPDQWEWIAAEA
jgi:hypothetical protein